MLNLHSLDYAQGLSSPGLELQELHKGKNLGGPGVEQEGVWTWREQRENSLVNRGPEEQQVLEAKGWGALSQKSYVKNLAQHLSIVSQAWLFCDNI